MQKFFLGPFAFRDPSMERRFRQYFMQSFIDRSRLVLCYFWFPVLLSMRIYWLADWFLNGRDVAFVDLIVETFRIFVLFATAPIFLPGLSETGKHRISVCLCTLARIVPVMSLVQVFGDQSDPQAMTLLVSSLCFCGLGIPSFSEYICSALSVPFIRPVLLYFSASPHDTKLVYDVLFQHSLILALGLSINWTVHSDCRRDWLRSPAASIHEPKQTLSAAAARGGSRSVAGRKSRPNEGHHVGISAQASKTATSHDWDAVGDDYFNQEDLSSLRAEALQARERLLFARHDPFFTNMTLF